MGARRCSEKVRKAEYLFTYRMDRQNTTFAQKFASVRPLILPALAFAILLIVLIIGINQIGADNIRTTIEQAGPFAPLLFITARVTTYVIAPLTTGPILFLSGIIFEPILAILYSLFAEALGGAINFWIARLLGRRVVLKLVGTDGIARVDQFTSQLASWQMLAYGRLFLFSIWDFLSYAAGFTAVSFRPFLIVSIVVGLIPVSAAVLFGSALTGDSALLPLYALVAVASLLPLLFQKRIKRWLRIPEEKGRMRTD